MKSRVLFAMFFFVTVNHFAQTELDSIYTKRGKIITGKVKEIGHKTSILGE